MFSIISVKVLHKNILLFYAYVKVFHKNILLFYAYVKVLHKNILLFYAYVKVLYKNILLFYAYVKVLHKNILYFYVVEKLFFKNKIQFHHTYIGKNTTVNTLNIDIMAQLINSVWLREAHLMDFYELMIIITSWLDKEDVAVLKIEQEALQFKNTLKEFSASLRQRRKTGFTAKLLEADQIRNSILKGMSHILKGIILLPENQRTDAAIQIKNMMTKHAKHIDQLPQREKSGVISSLLRSFQHDKPTASLNLLGLYPLVAQLNDANNRFNELYLARGKKEAEYVAGRSQQQRKKMQSQFERLCTVIEAHAVIEGKELYQPLIDKINMEVAKVKQLNQSRKTRTATNRQTV